MTITKKISKDDVYLTYKSIKYRRFVDGELKWEFNVDDRWLTSMHYETLEDEYKRLRMNKLKRILK